MAEIARLHPRGDHEEIDWNFANTDERSDRGARASIQIHAHCLSQQQVEILLAAGELSNGRGYLGRRENRRRHLVKQWLKDVVIAAVDEKHIGLGSSEGARRSN